MVSSDELFHLIGAYLPDRQGVQDHFGVIYADIQAECPSLLPLVGATFDCRKVCSDHRHDTVVAPAALDYLHAAKDGSPLLASLSPAPALGPRCDKDGCQSQAVMHQELSAGQPHTLLVAVDLLLYREGGRYECQERAPTAARRRDPHNP